MYEPDRPQNETPTVVVGDGRQPSQAGLLARLSAAWRAMTPVQKLLLAGGAGVLLAGTVALVVFVMPSSPTSTPTEQTTGSASSGTSKNENDETAPGANNPTGENPASPSQPTSNGQQKSKSKSGSGSTGSGSMGGTSSGGTGGGGSGGSSGGDSASCALPKYPDASCTGVPNNTTLAVITGDMSINTPNTVIEGKDIRGCVGVTAPGVIIRKSKITCAGSAVASRNNYTGTGLLLEDVEISCTGLVGSTAVGDFNFTLRRVNIHDCENGLDADGEILLEDSYIHNLIPYDPITDPHSDGIQITPVGENIIIKHNTIHAGDATSAIISPDLAHGPANLISNILIQDNLFSGGAYTLYCQQNGPGDNYRVINNHFSTVLHPTVGAFGPWVHCQDEIQVTGNVYHETGQPVPF